MHGQPRPYRLTPNMHDTLHTAAKHGPVGLRRVHEPDTKPAWPAHPATLTALVNRGLLSYERARHRNGWPLDRWTITDNGRTALKPQEITRRDVPVYLARSGGQIRYRQLPSGRWTVDDHADGNGDYTTDARKSIDHDLQPGAKRTVAVEVLVGPGELDIFARKAEERRQERLDAMTVDDRITAAEQIAASQRVNVTNDLRVIRYMLSNDRTEHATKRLCQLEERLRQRAA